MLGPLFKLATGMLLLPQIRSAKETPLQVQVELPAFPTDFNYFPETPPLPSGCEDYRLIAGDARNAKIFLLGERHFTCDTAREKCSKGLLAQKMPEGINPDQTVLLFENYSYQERIPCKEIGKTSAQLSNDCRGWNLPRAERKNEWWHAKGAVLQKLTDHFEREFPSLAGYPPATQQRMAAEYVRQWIEQLSPTITQYAHALTENRQQGHSISREREIRTHLLRSRFAKKHLTNIHKKIIVGKPLNSIVPGLRAKIARYVQLERDFIEDPERSVKRPNQAMIKAIREASRKKLTIVYAGKAHVDPTQLFEIEKQASKRQKIIEELYGELADMNPYAVLSCRLR